MADQFGIDIGNVLGQAEAIRAARINNQLSQNAIADQAKARELTPAALGGDQAATQSLFALDPQRAAQVASYVGGLDEQKRAALAQQTDEIGRAAAYVLSAGDKDMAYQQVRGMLSPEIQKAMPPVFDPQWVELQLANASSIDEILKRNAAPTPTTDLGKLKADLDAGNISQDQYNAAVAKETALPNSQSTQLAVDPATGAITFSQGSGPGGAPAVTEMPKLTEGQSKDVGFLTRGTGANKTLDDYETALTNPVDKASDAVQQGMGTAYFQSENYQKAKQAGLEFLAALLRKDSGGAITPDENSSYGQVYLPQPGNPASIIAQKRDARKRALDALGAGLPPAAILSLEQQGLLPKTLEEMKAATASAPAVVDPAATAAPAAPSATPPQLTNDAAGESAYAAMASGTQFLDPDGNLREKP